MSTSRARESRALRQGVAAGAQVPHLALALAALAPRAGHLSSHRLQSVRQARTGVDGRRAWIVADGLHVYQPGLKTTATGSAASLGVGATRTHE